MKEIIFLVIIILISFSGISQKSIMKSDFDNFDNIAVSFVEGTGCIIAVYSFSSVNANDKTGSLYNNGRLSGDLPLGALKQGIINNIIIDSIINILFNYQVFDLDSNQFDRLRPPHSAADGRGTCKIVIKKNKKYLLKTIHYPVPVSRSSQRDFLYFYTALNRLLKSKTIEIPIDDLIAFYKNPKLTKSGIEDKLISNAAMLALSSISDTSKVDNLIDLNNRALSDPAYYPFQKAAVNSLIRIGSEKALNYLAELCIKLTENGDCNFDNLGEYYGAIVKLENDSVKIHYLKKIMNLGDNRYRIYAAIELAMLKNDSGLDILYSELDEYKYDYLTRIMDGIVKINKTESLEILMKKYHKMLENDTINNKRKVIGNYLLALNSLLGYNIDARNSYAAANFYSNNLEEEMKNIEIRYKRYKSNK